MWRVVAAAVLTGLLIGAVLAVVDIARAEAPVPRPPVRPAPWEVSALIEEARRITREAT